MNSRNVFIGLGAGALYKTLTGWASVLAADAHLKIPFLKKGELGMDLSPALFGVGFILGPRIATVMVGGGLRNTPHFGQSLRVFIPPDVDLIKNIARQTVALFRDSDELRQGRLKARLDRCAA